MDKYELKKVLSCIEKNKFTEKGNYYRDIITFDIETCTLDKERSWMWIWMISVNGHTFYSQDWSDFREFIHYLNSLSEDDNKFVIWVHNLSYEFAYIQAFFEWDKVFATSPYKVLYCQYKSILFRCSYLMSGLSLAKLAKNYKLPVKKMEGDLDYKLLRIPGVTPITDKEFGYCENDVLVLHHYIEYMIREFKNFSTGSMPYTATGFTRKYLRDHAEESKSYKMLRSIVREGSPRNVVLYNTLRRAFAGGYTHANYIYVRYPFKPDKLPDGSLRDPIRSRDKTSFYPAIMVKEKFPRRFFKAKSDKFPYLIKRGYAVIFDVCLFDVHAKTTMTTISEHKCSYLKNYISDNGRIYKADMLVTTLTELDWDTINTYYDFDKSRVKIGRCFAAKKRYLPKALIEAVLHLYAAKTELKDVEGVEQEYQRLKGLLNSLYGCCVTDILQELVIYNGVDNEKIWSVQKLSDDDKKDALAAYTQNYKSLLLYQTGVYVTAYARHELLEHNWELTEKKVVYNDTDSIKYLWDAQTEEYFEKYNELTIKQVYKSLDYQKIDRAAAAPVDIKGREHFIGLMSDEGTYSHFKTLGCKRYIYVQKGDLHCTVAGLPKERCRAYLASGLIEDDRQGPPTIDDMMYKFSNQMVVPAERSGKYTHYYTRPTDPIYIQDYEHTTGLVEPSWGIALIEQPYDCTLTAKFKNFLEGMVTIESMSHAERLSNKNEMTKIKTFWEDFEKWE